MFSGTLAILFCAILIAFVRRNAIGFALFGWGYLALILWAGAETNIAPHLLTSKVLAEAESAWQSPNSSNAANTATVSPYLRLLRVPNTRSSIVRLWSTSPFQRIGHCLFALLFAAVGSVVARWLWSCDGSGCPPQQHDDGPSAGDGGG